MTQADSASAPWWEPFYDDLLADLFLVRTDADELAATVRFLTEKLGLGPGAVVFDQCCGIGSLSLPLAQRGVHVIGVDWCEAYVRRARQEAGALGLSCEFHRGDAFAFVPEFPCDAAFNWWTSFGYADDGQNVLMLQRAFEALRPDGWFALDFPNMGHVLREFQPCLIRRGPVEGGEVLLVRESTLNISVGRLEQQWTYVLPDGRRLVRQSAVRLYLPHVLVDMLQGCGFVEVELYGSVRGEALQTDSPRCICRARKGRP
jgi:SAM-dependent methyltransferase